MGGVFTVDGWLVGWFAVAITAFEEKLFGHVIGDASGQQTWEALAILIGLRLFKQFWVKNRATLEVRADNVTALAMLTRMRAKGQGVNLVARELALDLSDGCFRPDVCCHIPGITNKCCDALSRLFQPNNNIPFPKMLHNIPEFSPPLRENTYYSIISPSRDRVA